jgi:beta-xylosidase
LCHSIYLQNSAWHGTGPMVRGRTGTWVTVHVREKERDGVVREQICIYNKIYDGAATTTTVAAAANVTCCQNKFRTNLTRDRAMREYS